MPNRSQVHKGRNAAPVQVALLQLTTEIHITNYMVDSYSYNYYSCSHSDTSMCTPGDIAAEAADCFRHVPQ